MIISRTILFSGPTKTQNSDDSEKMVILSAFIIKPLQINRRNFAADFFKRIEQNEKIVYNNDVPVAFRMRHH